MFYLQACVQRGTKCPGKFSMNGEVALSYGLFPDSSGPILTKRNFLPGNFSLSENVVLSEAIF